MPTTRIFVCNNKREEPISCGLRRDASAAADHLKSRLSDCTVAGVEVYKSRCLGHCPQGPVLAVMPGNNWYTYQDESDLDEIVSEHLENGRPVERLSLNRKTPST